jgi:hypothetical protein
MRSRQGRNGGVPGCAIDGFDQGNAAAALQAVAGWCRVGLNGVDKVLEDLLVSAELTYYRRRGATVLVAGRAWIEDWFRRPEVSRNDAILLEDHSALRSANFHAARIARVSRRGRLEYS